MLPAPSKSAVTHQSSGWAVTWPPPGTSNLASPSTRASTTSSSRWRSVCTRIALTASTSSGLVCLVPGAPMPCIAPSSAETKLGSATTTSSARSSSGSGAGLGPWTPEGSWASDSWSWQSGRLAVWKSSEKSSRKSIRAKVRCCLYKNNYST